MKGKRSNKAIDARNAKIAEQNKKLPDGSQPKPFIKKNPSGCHIGFLVGIRKLKITANTSPEERKMTGKKTKVTEKTQYIVLGGNQGQKVKLTDFLPESIVAFRKPIDYKPCQEHYNLVNNVWVKMYEAELSKGKGNAGGSESTT